MLQPWQCDATRERDVTRNAYVEVSTCKQAYPVANLLDGNDDTYWQSDGQQPHRIRLTIGRQGRMVPVSRLLLQCDWQRDESYCPRRIEIAVDGELFHTVEIDQRDNDDDDN